MYVLTVATSQDSLTLQTQTDVCAAQVTQLAQQINKTDIQSAEEATSASTTKQVCTQACLCVYMCVCLLILDCTTMLFYVNWFFLSCL